MSDQPVIAAFESAPSPIDNPGLPAQSALEASALERLAPVLVALVGLWGLVYWALLR